MRKGGKNFFVGGNGVLTSELMTGEESTYEATKDKLEN